MVRIAQERIQDLFALAEREAARGPGPLTDRYVRLARKIGTRYNVRVLPQYREAYCRGCSAYWVEGRSVRTRLRSGRRVRTCLRCGRERRTIIRPPLAAGTPPGTARVVATGPEPALVGATEEAGDDSDEDDGPEEA